MTAVETQSITPRLLNSQRSSRIRRRGSFTDVEKFFLRALLVDPTTTPSKGEVTHPLLKNKNDSALDDTVLFQLPFGSPTSRRDTSELVRSFGRHEKKILGLWQAHEDGAHPVIMHKRRPSGDVKFPPPITPGSSKACHSRKSSRSQGWMDESSVASVTQGGFAQSVRTDVEVRPQEEHDDNSSWGEEDGGFVHYDAWEVLKDEYAEDFGFDFKETMHSISATLADDDDCQSHVFKILGTSADDQSAQPHVLSPPLMDSLLNFVPDSISQENYWLKFSLIRDGASLYTLKQYVKASPNTILAIETTKGDVFGAFTSHIWRSHPTFYGGAPSFLWRMRHNRRTPCHSLFEQAHMESEIDYYPFSGLNDLVQVCSDERLAIGGGKLVPDWDMTFGPDGKRESNASTVQGIDLESLDQGQNFGFGICLDEDLLSGTTSPCGTFRNPCLINNLSKGEVFEIANLELWTLTPCADVKSAERMEMTRYFVEESLRSMQSSQTSTNESLYSNPYSSNDEFQRDFYRRVGHNTPSRHQPNGAFEYSQFAAPSGRI